MKSRKIHPLGLLAIVLVCVALGAAWGGPRGFREGYKARAVQAASDARMDLVILGHIRKGDLAMAKSASEARLNGHIAVWVRDRHTRRLFAPANWENGIDDWDVVMAEVRQYRLDHPAPFYDEATKQEFARLTALGKAPASTSR